MALLVSVAACAAAFWRAKRPETPLNSLPRSSWFAWLIAVLAGLVIGWKIGALTSTDFLPDRGFLLGCVGGIAAGYGQRRSDLLGVAIALLTTVIGRLWLTHAELTGLTSLAMGMAVSLVTLRAESDNVWERALLPILVTAGFGLTAVLGFTRAELITDNYWADIPLIVGGLAFLAAAISPRPLVPVVVGVVAAAILYWYLAKTWTPFAALAIGRIVAGLAVALNKRQLPGSILGSAVAIALLIGGVTGAFLLAAGYGIGMFAIGALIVLIGSTDENTVVFSVVAFPITLIGYRLAMLSALDSMRVTGPGDIWNLIAIGLGLISVVIIAELLDSKRHWSSLQFLFAATVPIFALAYLWQPREMAGLFIGVALGTLAISVFGDPSATDDRPKRLLISGVVVSLVLLEIIPLLSDLSEPTRTDRLALVGLLAAVATVRALIPTPPSRRKGTSPKREGKDRPE